MLNARNLDEITRAVLDKLPAGVVEVQQDIEKNLRAAMQSVFAKMDLVTREEFDVQAAVLQRTRQKLEALEARIAELEKGPGE